MSTLNSRTEAGAKALPSLIPEGFTMAEHKPRARRVAPMHPGTVLADSIEGSGLSMRQVAKAIDMSPNGLNKVLLGKSPVTPETALRLARYLGTDDPEVWLRMQMDFDLWHARAAMKDKLAAIVPIGLPRT